VNCFVALVLVAVCSVSQSPDRLFSADGDTAYFGQTAIIRSSGHQEPSQQPALMGTAPEGTTTTTWGPEVQLTRHRRLNSDPFITVHDDSIFVVFSRQILGISSAPYLLRSFDDGQSWQDSLLICDADTADWTDYL
jgi:hypothetical protein